MLLVFKVGVTAGFSYFLGKLRDFSKLTRISLGKGWIFQNLRLSNTDNKKEIITK